MCGKFTTISLALFLWLFLASTSPVLAVTPPLPAQPSQSVADLAGVLDANTIARINAISKDLEDNTKSQVMVLTLNSLDGEAIEAVAQQTALKWGSPQKLKVNGVLLVVAVQEKKYHLEVGCGLEDILSKLQVQLIGKQILGPAVNKGDFSGGIMSAVTAISDKIMADRNKKLKKSRKKSRNSDYTPRTRGIIRIF